MSGPTEQESRPGAMPDDPAREEAMAAQRHQVIAYLAALVGIGGALAYGILR
ncbi:hypothetical protein [Streptomyces sp. NPDC006307]|uniref:hypothetical protein n=1 Tax=Streptomyces sp. NPDC006307 TaxID=3156748 RepID=UPI00339DF6C3